MAINVDGLAAPNQEPDSPALLVSVRCRFQHPIWFRTNLLEINSLEGASQTPLFFRQYRIAISLS